MRNQLDLQTVSGLSFTENSQINLETLSKSAIDQLATGGFKPSRPIEHHAFITWVNHQLNKEFNSTMIEPISISKNHARRINFKGKPDDLCPINQVLITRLVTRIFVPDLQIAEANEKLIPAIAISYSEQGIDVAFGTNVYACSNMNIYGSQFFSTYGSNKFSFENLKELIKVKVKTLASINDNNAQIIKNLHEKELSKHQTSIIINNLFEKAVVANMNRNQQESILNVTQVVRMQEEVVKRRIIKEVSDQPFTAWDLTQAGTENLKPLSNDMLTLYPTISRFNRFINEKVNV